MFFLLLLLDASCRRYRSHHHHHSKSQNKIPDLNFKYIPLQHLNDLDLAKWMERVSQTRKLSDLFIPGTYASGTYYMYYKRYQCQNISIRNQLDIGVRVLDFSVKKNGSNFILHHQNYDFYDLDQEIYDVKDFLKVNPSEFVIIKIRCKSQSNPKEVYDHLMKEFHNSKDKLFLKNDKNLAIQTIENVKGKVALLFDHQDYVDINKLKKQNPGHAFDYLKEGVGEHSTQAYKSFIEQKKSFGQGTNDKLFFGNLYVGDGYPHSTRQLYNLIEKNGGIQTILRNTAANERKANIVMMEFVILFYI